MYNLYGLRFKIQVIYRLGIENEEQYNYIYSAFEGKNIIYLWIKIGHIDFGGSVDINSLVIISKKTIKILTTKSSYEVSGFILIKNKKECNGLSLFIKSLESYMFDEYIKGTYLNVKHYKKNYVTIHVIKSPESKCFKYSTQNLKNMIRFNINTESGRFIKLRGVINIRYEYKVGKIYLINFETDKCCNYIFPITNKVIKNVKAFFDCILKYSDFSPVNVIEESNNCIVTFVNLETENEKN